jgi:hypothetical protein
MCRTKDIPQSRKISAKSSSGLLKVESLDTGNNQKVSLEDTLNNPNSPELQK